MGSDRLSFPIISRFPTFGSSLGVAAAPSVLVKEPKEELEELDMRPPVMETSRFVSWPWIANPIVMVIIDSHKIAFIYKHTRAHTHIYIYNGYMCNISMLHVRENAHIYNIKK